MREKIKRAKEKTKESARKLNRELKKSISTALVAAFGFLIALAWRDLIQKWIETISTKNPLQGQLITALIITIVSVLGILIVTKLFSVRE